MKISKDDARRVMDRIRDAQRAYAEIAGNAKCEKAKMIFLALDVAKLMAADETLDAYQDPDCDIFFGNLLDGMDVWKRFLSRRLRKHAEIADLFSGGFME